MRTALFLQVLLSILAMSFSVTAQAETEASTFLRVLSDVCVRNINNLGNVFVSTNGSRALSFDEAAFETEGKTTVVLAEGNGNLLLSVSDNNSYCMVRARRLDIEETESKFSELANKPPIPLQATRKTDSASNVPNGRSRTMSYTWRDSRAQRSIQLTLVTMDTNSSFIALGLIAVSNEQ